MPVTTRDIIWAAGIYEGEGCAQKPRPHRRGTTVEVAQADQWLPYKLQSLFGGHVRQYPPRKSTHSTYWRWTLSGRHARGFLMTIYLFLSPRRKEQVREVLAAWRDSSYRHNWNGRRISNAVGSN